MNFENKAGDHADTDSALRIELKAAGIPTIQEEAGEPESYLARILRKNSGQVKTSVIGVLYGWTFTRAWRYWVCEGPGIEVEYAQRLQNDFGNTLRANGDAGCRGPEFWFKGLACGMYHVDSTDGLKALADTIRLIVDEHKGRDRCEISRESGVRDKCSPGSLLHKNDNGTVTRFVLLAGK